MARAALTVRQSGSSVLQSVSSRPVSPAVWPIGDIGGKTSAQRTHVRCPAIPACKCPSHLLLELAGHQVGLN
jgi:hypothetical protein